MCLLVIGVILTACNTVSTPTPLPPTQTPTPDPALELLATTVPAGLPDNPLLMVLQPASPELAIEPEVTVEPGVGEVLLPVSNTQAELDLEDAILNFTSVTVDVVPVVRPADALQALCNVTEDVSAVWVDGVSFTAALAQNCGEPIYIVQREVNNQLEQGEAGVVIVNRDLGNPQLSVLNTRTYCRLGVDDFYSWLLPSMVFRANNVDPSTFEAIVDYGDAEAMVEAVAEGECTGAGLSGLVYDAIIEDNEDWAENISVAFGSPPIPFAVLMYPVEIQLGIRVALTEGLERLVDDEDASALLYPFLAQDGLQVVELDDFAEYDAFLDTVGLDFSILGS